MQLLLVINSKLSAIDLSFSTRMKPLVIIDRFKPIKPFDFLSKMSFQNERRLHYV